MGVVNLAHGEFMMMGAYVSYLVAAHGLPVALSFAAAPVAVGAFALVLEPVFFRRLYGRLMESILATWGLSIALRQIFQLVFGSGYKSVPYATDAAVSVFGMDFSLYRLGVIALAVLLGAAIALIEHRTNLGTIARAVMSNAQLASALGINTGRVYAWTLAAGAALAGLAGAVMAPLTSAYPAMGLSFLTNAFFAVLVAGLGSLSGLAFAAISLGGSDELVAILVDPVWGSVALVIVALVLVRLRRTA
jgi:urea transport system permease protein